MDWFDIISAVLGLATVILAGRRSKLNFWVGYVYNVLLFCLFWHQQLYAAMALQPVAFAINIFGHWRWTHPREDERSAKDASSLAVSSVTPKAWAAILAGVLVVAAGISLLLQRTDDPAPVLDGSILALTFLAQYLSAQKKWECWIVWLVVNAGNLALYITSGLHFMPLVSVLYLANGIWSLISWKKSCNKGE